MFEADEVAMAVLRAFGEAGNASGALLMNVGTIDSDGGAVARVVRPFDSYERWTTFFVQDRDNRT